MINNHNLRMARKYRAFHPRSPEMPVVPLLAVSVAWMVLFVAIVPQKGLITQMKTIPMTAGWYGGVTDTTDPFSHTRTAYGEAYDENAFTAASWQYPYNTILMVTNQANHKAILVRVNDKGPAKRLVAKGRTLDLSRAAFLSIADLNTGVIPISILEVKK